MAVFVKVTCDNFPPFLLPTDFEFSFGTKTITILACQLKKGDKIYFQVNPAINSFSKFFVKEVDIVNVESCSDE